MELVNKNYIRIMKYDLFNQLIIAYDNNSDDLLYFQKLLKIVTEYEKINSTHIPEIYIKSDDIDLSSVKIERQLLINAYVYANINNESDIAFKIMSYFNKPFLFINEFNDIGLLNYILNNSINIDEYFDGENEKLIFNNNSNTLEKGFIFKTTYNNLKIKK